MPSWSQILHHVLALSGFLSPVKVTILTRKRASETILYRLLVGILRKAPYEGVGCLKHADDGKEGDLVH